MRNAVRARRRVVRAAGRVERSTRDICKPLTPCRFRPFFGRVFFSPRTRLAYARHMTRNARHVSTDCCGDTMAGSRAATGRSRQVHRPLAIGWRSAEACLFSASVGLATAETRMPSARMTPASARCRSVACSRTSTHCSGQSSRRVRAGSIPGTQPWTIASARCSTRRPKSGAGTTT
jgi:hypothetical protein